MTAFATAADFADLLGITLTNAQNTRATNLLGRASQRIREAVGKTIDETTETYTRPGTSDERILLPETPVISVASVAIDGTQISTWYLAGNEIVRYGFNLVDRVLTDYPYGGGFGWEQQTLTITYTHGYATIPEICRSIALEMVRRAWMNPAAIVEETVGNVRTTFALRSGTDPPRGLAITGEELKELRNFFGHRAGSVWTGSAP